MKLIFTILVAFCFNNCFASFTYDENGNLTSDGVHTYVYNEESRLKEVQIGDSGIVKAKYFYDHRGQRIKKIEDGQTCYYINTHHRSCNGKQETFHFIEDQRIASVVQEQTEFLHNDHLGSPFVISDEDGHVVSRINYDPYGEPSVTPVTSLNGTYTFSGKELSNLNNYYFEARNLSPSLRGFNRPDPVLPIVGNTFSLNPYQYANNNPLVYIDSDGKIPLIPIAVLLAKEYASLKLSSATGGLSDLVSVRKIGTKIFKKSLAFLSGKVDSGKRARQIHGALDPLAQRRRTTAVVETKEGVRVVSSSEKRLSLSQKRLLKNNEIEGIGIGHAEITAVNAAREKGLTPVSVAASRPVCPSCVAELKRQLIQILSEIKKIR